mgnify:CR=1 FL=1
MRNLSAILADCRTAFGGLSESEKAAAAEALVGKNAMSGFLALMNAAPADIACEDLMPALPIRPIASAVSSAEKPSAPAMGAQYLKVSPIMDTLVFAS